MSPEHLPKKVCKSCGTARIDHNTVVVVVGPLISEPFGPRVIQM